MGERVDRDGVSLARAYWQRVVRPLLDDLVPATSRSVARIGSGSDVLRMDDAVSRDHDWGLRLHVFVPPPQVLTVKRALQDRLPPVFAGYPTLIPFTGQRDPVLGVDVITLDAFVESRLGFDPRETSSVRDWLSITGQAALELIGGDVFEDEQGNLSRLRAALAWYPDDVSRYVIASDWQRIDQELPLMGRAGARDDELGSRVIASRLVDVAMHLGFSLCRSWAPGRSSISIPDWSPAS